jgi:predicted transcriptional regulator
LYKPFYVAVIRTIDVPVKMADALNKPFRNEDRGRGGTGEDERINNLIKKSLESEIESSIGKTRGQAILDFCRVPRLLREIRVLLGFSFKTYFYDNHIAPLLENGRLKMAEPLFPRSHTNRYVAAEYAPPIASEDEILEYLKMPHDKGEIAKHFNLSEVQIYDHMRGLINSGWIIKIEANLQKSKRPKFVAADVWDMQSSQEKSLTGFETAVIDYIKTHGEIDRRKIGEIIGRGYVGAKCLVNKMMEAGLITGESISNVKGRKTVYRLK